MSEIWKPVKGFEGFYEVSNKGRVKSLSRRFVLKDRIMKAHVSKYGYELVYLSQNMKVKTARVHRLVGIAFIPNPENKPEINHKDGNKRNNHYYTKLTKADVLKIREMKRNGIKSKDIAHQYGVNPATISAITTRKNWKHI